MQHEATFTSWQENYTQLERENDDKQRSCSLQLSQQKSRFPADKRTKRIDCCEVSLLNLVTPLDSWLSALPVYNQWDSLRYPFFFLCSHVSSRLLHTYARGVCFFYAERRTLNSPPLGLFFLSRII